MCSADVSATAARSSWMDSTSVAGPGLLMQVQKSDAQVGDDHRPQRMQCGGLQGVALNLHGVFEHRDVAVIHRQAVQAGAEVRKEHGEARIVWAEAPYRAVVHADSFPQGCGGYR